MIRCFLYASLFIVIIQAQRYEEPEVLDHLTVISNGVEYLTSKTYKLSNRLTIADVMNFSLIGNINGTASLPTINCAKKGISALLIINSWSITIENIRLINCGSLTEKVPDFDKNIFPSDAIAATLFLYNVSSISVRNVGFLKSYNHAIVGINAISITLG